MGFYRRHHKDGHSHQSISLKDLTLWRAVFAEFFGTFLLVFIGCLSVLPSEINDQLDNLIAPALCFAAVIVTLIHIIGPTSGCHINPAVTLALVVMRRVNRIKAALYFPAQMLGATLGAGLLALVSPRDWCTNANTCMTMINEKVTPAQGVVVEIFATALLVLIVLVISDPDPHKDFEGFPSLAGGLAVLTCIYAAAPYTGASLNPARSFGPALIQLDFKNHWVYWVGPLTGSLLACGVYRLFLVQGLHKNDPPKQKLTEEPQELRGKSDDKLDDKLDDKMEINGADKVETGVVTEQIGVRLRAEA